MQAEEEKAGWLERLEPIVLALWAFYVGWVLGSRQLGLSGLFDETVQLDRGPWALGLPLLTGIMLPFLPASSLTLRLAQALLVRVGLGIWTLLVGWSLMRPISDFPWLIAWHLVPLIIGLHVPLALTTHPWPPRLQKLLRTLSWLCFCMAAWSALALVLADYVLPRQFWPRMLPFVVGLPALYRVWCLADNPQRVRRGLVLIVVLLNIVVGWLLLTYVGVT